LSYESFVHAVQAPPLRIALLGCGTVGSAVARRLAGADALRGVRLTTICDRRADIKRSSLRLPDDVRWTTSYDTVLESDADVVVEAIGGVDPAASWIRRALLSGKSVVTANKQVIATEGHALLGVAARQGRQLRFEAAVGGAMPIVRAISDGLAGDRLTHITAILNGTTNAVLSTMERTRCSLSAALAAARVKGYAEADPSLDLDGGDAAAKLAILCGLAFGLRVDASAIATRTASATTAVDIDEARRDGHTIRQIAHAAYEIASGTLTAWVAPVAVPTLSVFGRTHGANNAAVITGRYSGETTIAGAGAGGDATAVAIVGDLAAIARDRAAIVPAPVWTRPSRVVGFDHLEGSENRCLPADGIGVELVGAGFQTGPFLSEAV
jgi:homoserine dehydrogenase